MVLREQVSDRVPYPLLAPPPLHLVSYPPNTKLFRHLKQKLQGFFGNFLTKGQNSPLEHKGSLSNKKNE